MAIRFFFNAKGRRGKFCMIICVLFLLLLSGSVECYSNHLSLLTFFSKVNVNAPTCMVTPEVIDATNKAGNSAPENASVSTPETSSPINQYFLFSGIVLACFFLLFLMFLWITRTQKKYLILKNQNEELLCQISKDQKKRETRNHFSYKPNWASFRLKDSIFVKSHERMVRIQVKDILFIQADRNYCCLHTQEKEYLVVMPLKGLYQKLPSKQFLRIHRSFIINLSHIDEIGTGHVVIARKTVPLSKSSKEELLKHLQTI